MCCRCHICDVWLTMRFEAKESSSRIVMPTCNWEEKQPDDKLNRPNITSIKLELLSTCWKLIAGKTLYKVFFSSSMEISGDIEYNLNLRRLIWAWLDREEYAKYNKTCLSVHWKYFYIWTKEVCFLILGRLKMNFKKTIVPLSKNSVIFFLFCWLSLIYRRFFMSLYFFPL